MNNKENWQNQILKYLRLGKYSVIFPVSLTAFTGYFLYSPTFNLDIIMISLGVFLQGTAASSLNQVQEKEEDALMQRTKKRPLPSGRLSTGEAILFTVITFILGSVALWIWGNLLAVFLGIFTLIWYNGFYTYLKKHTAFAVIPGSLTGAIPPVIGWTAAGGEPLDLTAVLLAFLFFMGQVPHFWLLIMKYGEEYRNAGFSSLTDIFSTRQINNLSFIWITSSLISAMMLAFFGILENKILGIILIVLTFMGIYFFSGLLNNTDTVGQKKYFLRLNLYYLSLIVLLITDKIF
jgi:protoheme IX farnesyltransferase